MSATLVATTQATKTATTGTTFTASTAPITGNTHILGISVSGGTANLITGIADTKGNTYSKVGALAGGGSGESELWYAPITAGGSGNTVTLTISGNHFANVWVREYSGLDPSPLDKTAQATSATTAVSSGATAATTVANELVIGVAQSSNGTSTYTAGSGFGNLVQATVGSGTYDCAMEDEIVAATGAQTATFTLSAAGSSSCIVATFKIAASAGFVTAQPTNRARLVRASSF